MKHLSNVNEVLTLESAHKKDGRNLTAKDLDTIKNASIIYDNDSILWVGETKNLPPEYNDVDTVDLSGHCITPEIVDSHTHLVFAGNRSNEYSMRLNGSDYQEIAMAGGGILATSMATKKASDEELFNLAVERIERLYSYGIGTIEIKSGYALNFDDEYRCSKVIKRLKDHFSPKINIVNTFMAAHAVPKEFNTSEKYLNELVIPLMEKLNSEGMIDVVDIFHEQGYFTLEDTKNLFTKAQSLNLKCKIHADEFGDNGGAIVASQYQALSADHLLCTGNEGIEHLSKSSTVATLLPGTGWFLGKPQSKGRVMQDLGCKVAIASDYNPGSCHFDNLLQIASMAAPMYPFNMCEMWSSITLNAAHALDLKDQGAIIKNLKPRFTIFECNTISDITYSWGRNFCKRNLI